MNEKKNTYTSEAESLFLSLSFMTSFNFFKRDCACFQWGGVSLPERSSDDEGVLYRYKNGKSHLIYNTFSGRNFVALKYINAAKTYWIKWQTIIAANTERNKTTGIFFFFFTSFFK